MDGLLEAMADPAVVLDAGGRVVAANSVWAERAPWAGGRTPIYGIDAPFVERCRSAQPGLAQLAEAVEKILAGQTEQASVHLDLPAASPSAPPTGAGHRIHARAFLEADETRRVLVTYRPPAAHPAPAETLPAQPDSPEAPDVRELFTQFTANTSTIYWVVDWTQKKVHYISPAFAEVFGHPIDALYASPRLWVDCIHPDDREQVCADAARAQEIPGDQTYRIIRADGEVRWLRGRTFPVSKTSGPTARVIGLAEDVTEQVRAQRRIRQSEERYRAAVEGGLDAFFLFDPVYDDSGDLIDFVFVDLNENGARMISRTRDEVLGQHLCALLPVNREDRFFGVYKEVALTGKSVNDEFEIQAAAEGIQAQWMERQVIPVGQGIAISARDITSRKLTELELKHQREENQTILDGIPAFVFYKDTQNRILRVNRAVCEAQGVTADQIEGRQAEDIYPEEAAAYFEDDLAVMRSGKPKLNYIEKFVTDDETRWIRTDKVPLYDPHGEPRGVIAVASDVTALKETTERLAESEHRFRSLFDRVPVSVWEQDLTQVAAWLDGLKAQGVTDLAAYLAEHPEANDHAVKLTGIQSVNHATYELMGARDRDELMYSMRHGSVGPPPEALLVKLLAIWHGQSSAEMETYCHQVSGKKIYVLFRFEVPELRGQPDFSRAIVALTDISANRQRLFAQAQADQAERERQILGRELHDTLAQQLTGVNMLAESLRRRIVSRQVEEAETRAAELTQLVGQANSEVRRLISGLSPERIAPDELETALESLAENITLVHSVPTTFHCSRSPEELDEDTANHLLFIAQEAAHNAAKHAKASSIRITLQPQDHGLTLEIADDGIGLHTPRVPSGNTSSGLGLGIMNYRAEAIGGRLEFVAASPSGTLLRCTLPATARLASPPLSSPRIPS
ncbi:MAG: PAS domain S-box protein [Planctomycetota bacterium]